MHVNKLILSEERIQLTSIYASVYSFLFPKKCPWIWNLRKVV